MIDIERSFSGVLPLELLAADRDPLQPPPTEIIRLGWRHCLHAVGAIPPRDELDLSLLDSVRLAALGVRLPPETFNRLVVQSPEPSDADSAAIATAATVALRDPMMIRWIAANTDRVAKSPQWHQVVQGLGGQTVSVPLAEEALFNLMKAKTRLPRLLGESVQMNVWFSKRFAARFRRRTGAKRLRVRERGATTRAWSHARTSLGRQVPFEWSSRHGRGSGRPLDDWSTELLGDYVELFEATFAGHPPAMVASLYAIASGAIGHKPAGEVTDGWDTLPLHVENSARAMLGLDAAIAPDTDLVALRAMANASHGTGETITR